MVNQEIFSGLKAALERKQSLKRAMMTFFNAGYRKEDIEEAARHLSEPLVEPEPEEAQQGIMQKENIPKQRKPVPKKIHQKVSAYGQVPVTSRKIKQTPRYIVKTTQKNLPQRKTYPIQQMKPRVSDYGKVSMPQVPQPAQKASTYEKEPKKGKAIIIILILLLLLLIGILVSIFIFKQQLIDFFSNLFG